MPGTDQREDAQTPIRSLTAGWLNRNLVIRVTAYLAGAHLFAAFLFLLFEAGGRHGR